MGLPKFQTVEFNYVTCGVCSIPFYMPEYKYKDCKEDGKEFHCPNGHSLHFIESETKKLQKQIDIERQQKVWAQEGRDIARRELEEEKKSKAAIKGVLTKVKKRVSNGICLCCNRTFLNLQRHMKTKHPEKTK